MLMTQKQFEEQIEGLKKASTKKFDTKVEFTHYDIKKWIVGHTNKNEEIENTLQDLSTDYREVEHRLFNIKVK